MSLIKRSFIVVATILISTALAIPAIAADFSIDSNHSSAIFRIKHYDVAYFYGAFKTVEGSINYDGSNPSASSINVTIDATSVDSRNANRDEHIQSPDFLNAKQFPVITFVSKKVTANGDDLEVTGTLTMHGVSKDITVTATKVGEGQHPRRQKPLIGFLSEFTVKRSDFDMNFMQGPLSDEIQFILSLEAVSSE